MSDQQIPSDRGPFGPYPEAGPEGNILLGGLLGEREVQHEAHELDSPESLYQLQRNHVASEYMRDWYTQPDLTELEQALAPLDSPMHTVDDFNNQFVARLLPAVLTEDPNEALEAFRAISPNTVDEEMALLLNDEQFHLLHTDLHEHLAASEGRIASAVDENITNISAADRFQFSGKAGRSLEFMRTHGADIRVAPTATETVRRAASISGDGILPITEYLKNERILSLTGFDNSKISLAVHDIMDHEWTFAMLDRAGLLEKYADMFDSIGRPEATDIFKREGEVVASVAYGVRYYFEMQNGFGPSFRTSQIESVFDEYFTDGTLEPMHMDAYRTLKSYRRGSMQWQSLGFAFSNYITELDEQRRKHGTIKQRDVRTGQTLGEFDPLSADYLAFFVEAHREILNPEHKHRDNLFRVHILIEEYLRAIGTNAIAPDEVLTISVADLDKVDYSATSLPPGRLKWMFKNPGFTATKGAII